MHLVLAFQEGQGETETQHRGTSPIVHRHALPHAWMCQASVQHQNHQRNLCSTHWQIVESIGTCTRLTPTDHQTEMPEHLWLCQSPY